MGILKNTVSICQFKVLGTDPQMGSIALAVGEKLAGNGFRSIEQTSEESSIGWVQLDDYQNAGFDDLSFQHDHYLAFSLRHDQRKIPAAILKSHALKAEESWLNANQQFKRVPKQQREDIRDSVRASLFPKTLPVPSVYDVVWDTRSSLITFSSISTKAIDLVVDMFKKSFDGLRLVPLHPMARAEMVVPEPLKKALADANLAGSEAVLDQIESNRWLGADLMLWLMHETMNASSEYAVRSEGPAKPGEAFVAYLNDRLLLSVKGENGVQKVTATGPQDNFNEVRTALDGGKEIQEAVLYMEKQDKAWKMTLKGGSFHFASFKAPKVTLERDDLTDPAMEREAVFYERMFLLEEGLQMFNSLLSEFLSQRLDPSWASKEQEIRLQLVNH